jgi:hypothetical protein
VDRVNAMLELYRTRYRGFTVKHFHEHLVERHGYRLGYTFTKLALQGAGRVQPLGRDPDGFGDDKAGARDRELA